METFAAVISIKLLSVVAVVPSIITVATSSPIKFTDLLIVKVAL